MDAIDFVVDLFKKKEEDSHRRECILDKRVAESKGQILLNLSDYVRNQDQIVRIESIIDKMVEMVEKLGFEASINGRLLKTGFENRYYAISVSTKKGELFVEIPVKLINNQPYLTFSGETKFTLLYRNFITKTVKLSGVI